MKRNLPAIALFLMGLFSQTQIYLGAFMDITEAVCYILGPLFFFMDLPQLKKNGFGAFLWIWILCMVGCCVSSWVNNTPFPSFLRGIGAPVSVFCLACTFHHFLMHDFRAFKWFFLGSAISGVLCIFVLQRGTSRIVGGEELSGAEATEATVNYSLFWLTQIGTWLMLPIQMRYLKTPKWYSIAVVLFFILFGILSAASRSTFGVMFLTLILILIGNTHRNSMGFIKKNFALFSVICIILLPLVMGTYKYLAAKGMLGEASKQKYLVQTERGSGFLSLLKSGRGGFFIGLDAATDRPILGFGPWALDTKGYVLKHADEFSSEEWWKYLNERYSKGKIGFIPSHSYVINFWVWYGILGLICMLYIGRLYFTTLKNNLDAIPELYGYFAFILPPELWAWFFSPFGRRTYTTLLFVLCLFARAVAENRFRYVGMRPPLRRLNGI